VFANPGVKLFCEKPNDLKVVELGEIESIFRGGKLRLDAEAVEAIASMILKKYKGSKEK